MKKIILIILALITAHTFQADAQDILWKKNIGLNTTDDFGRAVVEASDGGIVVAGYTASYGAGGLDVWLIKTDADGDTLWTKTYGGVGDDYAYSLKQTSDGGFVIGGATNSYGIGGLDYYLIKTNSLGDTLWTKAFGDISDDICYSIDLTADGGYALAGVRTYNPDEDVWIIKVDSMGNYQWDKIYGEEPEDDRGFDIKQTEDGSFIVSGSTGCNTGPSNANCDGWLIKIDSMGDTLWTRIFVGSDDSDYFESVSQTSDGGYIVTGTIANPTSGVAGDLWLLKTDSLGNVEWEKIYDYNNEYDIGYSVQQTIDGGYIVCGSGEWDIDYGWIIRTNEFGDTLWTKLIESYTLSPLANADTYCQSVIQAQNGDYIIAGSQTQISFQKEAMLLRISSDIVPVELTSFTVTAQHNNVTLNWQTATETNNSGFEIERKQVGSPQSSVSNQDWNQIAFIPGFGTTTEPKSYSFVDENLSAGKYQYRLKQIDFDGSFEYSNTIEAEISSPTEFSLEQNYPNPFNPTTKIKYTIPSTPLSFGEGLGVRLLVYDILGNEVATLVNEPQQPGTYEVEFNVGQAISLSSGVYYYQLRSGSFVETKKMLILK
ncbi:MAG: T9SS type A sorting domain-containing protein [Ignavibacteriales bacterium]|nr:T9SS type A sorting domain-containing protein [Ignavibacteriales bacterium]